jgi:hypothetical protein
MTIWRLLIACWVPRLQIHSSRVILIARPPQQWLHERTSMLSYTFIACLVIACWKSQQECYKRWLCVRPSISELEKEIHNCNASMYFNKKNPSK